jgi:CheY-like chemotaxis protein
MSEQPRVLWVDDELNDLLKPVRRLVERKGLNIATATNAARAEELLTNERFDAVILDITVPAGSPGQRQSFGGLDLIRRLDRTPNAQTPIVGLSVVPYGEIQAEFEKDGGRFAAYFDKASLFNAGAEGVDGLVARIRQLREASILNTTP